jgi:hypothetical protein
MLAYLFLNDKKQPFADKPELGGGIWFTLNKSLAKTIARVVAGQWKIEVDIAECELPVFAQYLREYKVKNIVRIDCMRDTGFLSTPISTGIEDVI